MPNNIRYAYFSDKFEVIHRNEKDSYAMPPHTHNAIEIYLNLSDIQSALLGTNILPLKADTLLIIPSYCIHQFMRRESDIYDRYILTINTEWLSGIMGTDEDAKYGYLKNQSQPLIISLSGEQKRRLITLLENCLDCGGDRFFKNMSCFFEALDFIHEAASKTGAKQNHSIKKQLSGTRKTVTEIIEYINAHLYDNIHIQDIADKFFLSPDYAAKIFKKYTNTPIGNYITIQRITGAKQMLREGSTVTEAQMQTGYASYEHFFRTFKKTVGITPREYRMRHYQNKGSNFL